MKHVALPGMDEIKDIALAQRSRAIWNLFWLSIPSLDKVPGSGNNWWRKYTPVEGALVAIKSDVIEDEVLYRKLCMHPSQFFEWFGRERDHSIYNSFATMGGKPWVNLVLNRAEEAAERLLGFNTMRIDWKNNGTLVIERRRSLDSV
jgi:hypothetical protein